MAEKEHRAQDYAEGGLNLKINFRKLKYYVEPKPLYTNYLYLYILIHTKMISLNKKDLIAINQEVGSNGKLHNEDRIDFALSITKQNKSWLYELSYIVRSLLVDHCFEDGNKRTAIIVIITYFEKNNLDYDKDKLIKTVWNISKKNINDINKLMRMIKNAIVP